MDATPKRCTIKQLAVEIQQRWPHLRVEVDRGYCNTDRKPRGCPYITHTGKGRWGSRIKVFKRQADRPWLIFEHNNAETYRTTEDVVRWMDEYAAKQKGRT